MNKQYLLQFKGTCGRRFLSNRRGDDSLILYATIQEALSDLWRYAEKGCDSFTWRICSRENGKNKPLDKAQLVTSIGDTAYTKLEPYLRD